MVVKTSCPQKGEFAQFAIRQTRRCGLASAIPEMNKWALAVSKSEMRHFSARSRKARDCAETYIWYVAQGIPLIDAEIAKKGHFWMETSYCSEWQGQGVADRPSLNDKGYGR